MVPPPELATAAGSTSRERRIYPDIAGPTPPDATVARYAWAGDLTVRGLARLGRRVLT